MPDITKSRAKIEAYALARKRDKRAAELMAAGMDNQAAYIRVFDEETSAARTPPSGVSQARPMKG